MTTEREEALELAREVCIANKRNRVGDDFSFVSWDALEVFYRLAKQRGAEERKQLERELSAANARIAELDGVMRTKQLDKFL